MQLYPSPCSYFPEKVSILAGLNAPWMTNALHARLIEYGFRHSGHFFYLPRCPQCHACLPIRVPTATFEPTRSQRRIWRKNEQTKVSLENPELSDEKVDIYRRYVQFQHQKNDVPDYRKELQEFLYQPLPSLREMVFRRENRIVAISIVDVIEKFAFSSVYHYFDPDFAHLSLGTFSAMSEIEYSRTHEIPYYYLGLWIPSCPKMLYKNHFSPNEIRWKGEWIPNTPELLENLELSCEVQ